jgi:hypothetical protein
MPGLPVVAVLLLTLKGMVPAYAPALALSYACVGWRILADSTRVCRLCSLYI